ncbi:MAG: UDP-N-acetylmuramate dehydrogenase [Roseivirga sp.]|jgi:UDP-N-acetylmuramate dehydrogenase
MPSIEEKVALLNYNTFGLAAEARYFFRLQKLEDLIWLAKQEEYKTLPILWLGGGSNILLTQDFDGLVIKVDLLGISLEVISEDESLFSAFSGENWHEFVVASLDNNLGGLENLSLIPGNVGTAPIQNIGAYGVEVKDHLESVEAVDLKDNSLKIFSAEECKFAYRDSIFKSAAKGRFLIVKVTFRLRQRNHKLRMDYGAIKAELNQRELEPNIHNISQAIIAIRSSKLPNPAEIGNSGSFFKNPVVSQEQYLELKAKFPEIVAYPATNQQMKLAAGWLIEKAGWKGFRRGDAGVHNKQALVLVNYGSAKGAEIKFLAEEILHSIYSTFAVQLEMEVNLI